MHNNRVLVTGGAGFIGSHLCRALLNRGDEVICLDNFMTGKRSNIAQLKENKRFSVVCHDIKEPFEADVDEIYNLACPASPTQYQVDPIDTLMTSVLGVKNMLDLAVKNGCKILQASTSEVYGDPLVHPQAEHYWGNVNPIGLRSCYDEGKRCAETLMLDYHRKYNVKIKIVRIFNAYGPFMDVNDGRVISNFIVQAIKGRDLTIYGTGSQTRCFQYIGDLVDGLILMMKTSDDFTGPINMGNTEEITVLDLAEKVLKIAQSKSILRYEKIPADDPKCRKPDISLASNKLGWSPRITMEDGLKRTLRYFEDVMKTK